MPSKHRPCDVAARARYDAKTYDRITVKVRKPTAAAFRAACAANGDSQAGVLNAAIAAYIADSAE